MNTRRTRRSGLTLLEMLIVLTILVALGTIIVPSLSYLGKRSQKLASRENLCRLQDLIVNRYIPDMGELPRPAIDEDTGDVLETGREDHPQLRYLFVNPDRTSDANEYNDQDKATSLLSDRNWQGPYTMHTGAEYDFDDADTRNFTTIYGVEDDPVIYDAWGHPIVLQWPTETPTGVVDEDGDGSTDDEILEIQRRYVRLVSAGPDGVLDTPIDKLMPDDTDSATDGRDDDILVFLFRHDEHGDGYLNLEEETR